MFAKCAVLIVAVGACGCALLALRQQRLQVASELARTQLRISRADERLWMLRTQIAARTSPRNVEQMARDLGPLKPIVDNPIPPEAIARVPQGQPARTPRTPSSPPRPRTDAAPRPSMRIATGSPP